MSRSTLYAHVPELAERKRTAVTTAAQLPTDTRPLPDVAIYDELLTRNRPAPADG